MNTYVPIFRGLDARGGRKLRTNTRDNYSNRRCAHARRWLKADLYGQRGGSFEPPEPPHGTGLLYQTNGKSQGLSIEPCSSTSERASECITILLHSKTNILHTLIILHFNSYITIYSYKRKIGGVQWVQWVRAGGPKWGLGAGSEPTSIQWLPLHIYCFSIGPLGDVPLHICEVNFGSSWWGWGAAVTVCSWVINSLVISRLLMVGVGCCSYCLQQGTLFGGVAALEVVDLFPAQ